VRFAASALCSDEVPQFSRKMALTAKTYRRIDQFQSFYKYFVTKNKYFVAHNYFKKIIQMTFFIFLKYVLYK
jgi:hypothetical protein